MRSSSTSGSVPDPPPVRVPRLAGTDSLTWLALELLPGQPLGAGRYHAGGFLSGPDREALEILLRRCGEQREFCHGDLIPANLWLLARGRLSA